MIIAAIVSSMVAGRRAERSSQTGRVVNRLVPRSPDKQLPIIVDELDQQRPVEPELLAQQLDLRARCRLARQLGDRIGRNDARDEEHDGDKAGKRRDQPGDALKDERRDPH